VSLLGGMDKHSFEKEFFCSFQNYKSNYSQLSGNVLLSLSSFENLENPKEISLISYLNTNKQFQSPLNFKLNYVNSSEPSVLWRDNLLSSDLLQEPKQKLNLILTDNSLVFFKDQINLNKFFIEKSLYMFSGVDWVYYYFLPKTYQNIVYQYSEIIRWVLSNTSSYEFSVNCKQIDNLVSLNKLGEISTIKLNKKI